MNDRIEEIKERMRHILASHADSHLTDTPKMPNICPTSGIVFLNDARYGHRSEAMEGIPLMGTTKRLQEVLRQKQDELRLRERDLASPCYCNDEWTQRQIACFKEQIQQINQYLRGGASISLPRCCASGNFICLIAITSFDSCIMQPIECGFSLSIGGGAECQE